jgi:hypothetical protein
VPRRTHALNALSGPCAGVLTAQRRSDRPRSDRAAAAVRTTLPRLASPRPDRAAAAVRSRTTAVSESRRCPVVFRRREFRPQ